MVTPLQHKIYEFVRDYIHHHEYSPSLEEIARGIGISPKSISLISRGIHALVAAGRLKFATKGYRNIHLPDQMTDSLPILGYVASGSPIEPLTERSLNMATLLQGNQHFVLQVKGDAMADENIVDGDFVICKRAEQAQEGDMVVALLNQRETTLKRISYQFSGRITLIPANTQLKPRSYLPQQVQIQGVFVGIMRLKDQ